MKNLVLVFSVVLTLWACKKEEISFGTTPSLEFVSISPSSITELQDEVIVTVLYRDGDGDLGENTPDIKNLFVTDSRNDVQYSFRVQQLAPSESGISIEGQLEINLKTLTVVSEATTESASFEVYIVDRAGNKSNVINTSIITISK